MTNYTKIALIVAAALFLLVLITGVGAGSFALAVALNSSSEEKPEVAPQPPAPNPDVAAPVENGAASETAKPEGGTDAGSNANAAESGDGASTQSPSEGSGGDPSRVVATLSEQKGQPEPPPSPPAATVVDPEASPEAPAPVVSVKEPGSGGIWLPENEIPWLAVDTKVTTPEFESPVVLVKDVGVETASFELVGVDSIASVDPMRRPQIGSIVLKDGKIELHSVVKQPVLIDEKTPIANLSLRDGDVQFRWDKGVGKATGLNDRPALANSLRYGLLRLTSQDQTRYIALEKPLAAERLPIIPPTEPLPLSRPDAMLPRRGTLVFQVSPDMLPSSLDKHSLGVAQLSEPGHYEEIPEKLLSGESAAERQLKTDRNKEVEKRKDGLAKLDPEDRDPQSKWVGGFEIKYQDEPLLEAKIRVDQLSEMNELRVHVQATAIFAYADAGRLVVPKEGSWTTAVKEVEKFAKQATDNAKDARTKLENEKDPERKKALAAPRDRAERIERIAGVQNDLFQAFADGNSLVADLAVGAKYGDDVPIVWIYGQPKEEAKP